MERWEKDQGDIMDPETMIERIMDAYDYETFLQIIFTEEHIFESVTRLLPELCDQEDFGET